MVPRGLLCSLMFLVLHFYTARGQLCPNSCSGNGVCESGTCLCNDNWSGSNCSVFVCQANNPCLNGGTCSRGEGNNDFKCTCPAGYGGTLCECNDGTREITLCPLDSCGEHGTCTIEPATGNETCVCEAGYGGTNCEIEVDYCLTRGCGVGECTNTYDSTRTPPYWYNCSCPEGWASDLSCESPEHNYCYYKPCENGECSSPIPFTKDGPKYICTCDPGYTGVNCSTNFSYCDDNPCNNNGTCNELDDQQGYNCSCPPYWTGNACQIAYDPCKEVTCYHGGVCQSNFQTLSPGIHEYNVSCDCPQNFTGSHCQEDVDECSLTPPTCQNGATCVNTYGSYLCFCPAGFTGNHCDDDVNECAINPCQHGVCKDGLNSYTCNCNSTQFTGPTCEIPLSETCIVRGCNFNGVCEFDSLLMKPVCSCQTGFSGEFCSYKYHPCSEAHCNPEGTMESFKNQSCILCQCKPGYSGPTCGVNIYNTCAYNHCYNGGSCFDVNGTYQCFCAEGYSGRNCEINSQSCQGNLICKNNGTCIRLQEDEFCKCASGWGGKDCSSDIDECYHFPCKNGGTCTNTKGGYKCTCPTEYEGQDCQTLNSKLTCDSSICKHGGSCVEGSDHLNCSCPEGYEGVLCEKEVCPHPNCTELANNGKCDWHCFNEACDYDGGRDPCYTKSGIDPWANCSVAECRTKHNNDYCDLECNNARCLYDGDDCNTACNGSCNVPVCPSDMAICDKQLFLPNDLILIIASDRSIRFEGEARTDFLNSLGRLIHAEVVLISYREISRNELITEGYSLNLTLGISERGYIYWRLVLRINIQNCIEACPTTIQQVLNTIQAAYSNGQNEIGEFGIVDAISGDDNSPSGSDGGDNTGQVVGAVVGISAGVILVMIVVVVLGKRVRDNGGVKETFRKIRVRGTFRIPGGSTPEPSETNLMMRDRTSVSDRRSGSVDTYDDPSPNSRRKGDGPYPHFTWTQMEAPVNGTSTNGEGGGATCVTGQKGKDNRKWSYLHCEAARPTGDIREVLGQNGTMLDVNTKGPGGLTPLMIAIMAEDRHRRSSRLHPGGSVGSDSSSGSEYSEYDPMLISYSPKFPRMFSTIVHSKPMEAKVPALIHAPCTDVNITNDQGETALHLAVKHGRDDYIHYLIMAKADPNIQDKWGKTPLHVAIGAASDRAFQILIDCPKINLELRSQGGITPLMLSVKMGNNRMVQQLIAKSAEITGTDNEGRTAVHWAAMINNVEALKLLIKQGPDNIKDAPNLKGETALFLACREGSLGSVRHLLDCYANATLVDSLERSPLQIAYEKQNFDVIEMLQHSNQGPLGGPSTSLYPMKPSHSATNPMFSNGGTVKIESSTQIPSTYPQSSVATVTAPQSSYQFGGISIGGGMTRYPSIEAELECLLASTIYPDMTPSFLYPTQPHVPNTSPGIVESGHSPGHSIISPASGGVSPGDSNTEQTFSPQNSDVYAMSSHTSPQAGQIAAYSSTNNPIVSSTSSAQVLTGSTPLQHLPTTYSEGGAMLPGQTTADLQETAMEQAICSSSMQSCNHSPPMAQTVSPHPTPLTMAQATTTNGYSPGQVSVSTENNSPSSHYGFPSPPKEAGEYGKYGGTSYSSEFVNSLTPSPEDGNSQQSENSPLTQQQQQYTTIHGQYTYTSDPYSISLQQYNPIRAPQIPRVSAFNPKESTV